MSTQIFLFNTDTNVNGERVSSGAFQTVPMIAGDYGAYDTSTQKFTLYPRSGDAAYTVYAAYSTINGLTASGVMGLTGASLPTGGAGLPTGSPYPAPR